MNKLFSESKLNLTHFFVWGASIGALCVTIVDLWRNFDPKFGLVMGFILEMLLFEFHAVIGGLIFALGTRFLLKERSSSQLRLWSLVFGALYLLVVYIAMRFFDNGYQPQYLFTVFIVLPLGFSLLLRLISHFSNSENNLSTSLPRE